MPEIANPTPDTPAAAPSPLMLKWVVFDTNRNTFNHLPAIKALGDKVTVIRYLAAGLEGNEKVIKQGEAHALAMAGIRLGLVYEISGRPSGAAVGARDGAAAKVQAIAAGAPNDGSVVLWYTVDWDAGPGDVPGIKTAFAAFKAAVDPSFRVGAYASGYICDQLYASGLIVARWLTDSSGFRGTRDSIAAGRYEMRQLLPRNQAGIDTDPDVVRVAPNGTLVGIGDFVPFSDGKPGDDPVYAPLDPIPSPAPDGAPPAGAPASPDGTPLPPKAPPPPAPAADDTAAIIAIANASPIARYNWHGRGIAPPGYTQGMALTFAQTYRRLKAAHPGAIEMAKANTHNDRLDALAWYNSNFAALGMNNDTAGPDTLRHLFVLMLGHGMRESSGMHCCGRDRSATNVSSDTAEAGLFQTSYNAHTCHPTFDHVMDDFLSGSVGGFPLVFAHGVTCSSFDWTNFGNGRGADFQRLCKTQPSFSAETAAITLRNLRTHYGPVNRKECELRPEANEMFRAVQAYVDQGAPSS